MKLEAGICALTGYEKSGVPHPHAWLGLEDLISVFLSAGLGVKAAVSEVEN